jgi:16S rRNA (guanine(966)-N(2))-methyltransferase RsmD
VRIIGGEARGRRLVSPPGKATRPPLDRVRESVFAILGGGFEGGRVLDLFAGSGAFGLEALSRGARFVLFVEKSPAALAALRRNLTNLGFGSRSEVLRADALAAPRLAETQPWSLVFLDPPFTMFAAEGEGAGARAVNARVEEILGSPQLLPGGAVVLRLPAKCPWKGEARPREKKVYGESTVLFFARDPAPEGPAAPAP